MRELTVWRNFTYQPADRSKRCDPTYRIQKKVEYPPEWTMVPSIEQKGRGHVRYQGTTGTIDLDIRTQKFVEDIWKYWGENIYTVKYKGLSD